MTGPCPAWREGASHSPRILRCDLDAGHTGLHQHEWTWEDIEDLGQEGTWCTHGPRLEWHEDVSLALRLRRETSDLRLYQQAAAACRRQARWLGWRGCVALGRIGLALGPVVCDATIARAMQIELH